MNDIGTTILLFIIFFLFAVLVLSFLYLLFLSIKESICRDRDNYNEDVKTFIKNANKNKIKFVSLDFDSFKPLFELAPSAWIFRFPDFYHPNRYLYLFHKENWSAPGSYVIFENYKDYKKVEKLFKDYQSIQQVRKDSQRAIENFDSFKKLIQVDIDAKRKTAEKEIEEANQFLNNLTKKE